RSTQAQHDVKDDGQCQHHTQLDPVVGVQRLIHAEPGEHVGAGTNGHGHHQQHQFGNAQWFLEGLIGLGHYWFPPIAPAVAPAIDAEADTPFAAIGMSVSSGWSPGETGGASGINAVAKSIRISWAWLRSCAGSPVSTRWRLYPGSRDRRMSVDSSGEGHSTWRTAWGTRRYMATCSDSEPTKYCPRIHRKPTANDVANKIKNTPTMVNSGQERRPVGTASSSSSAGGGVLVGCAASDAPCSKAA